MNWKPVNIPELSYDAVKFYAESHNLKIQEVMKRLLFEWTLNFWSDPEAYGCILDKKEQQNEQQTDSNS